MASSSSAVENNNRLFPPFAKKLAQDDPATYALFADKLAGWLSSERAYYPEARPEIIKLLLTAHSTLRRAVGASPSFNSPFNISNYIDHPMAAPYSRVMKAIHPHRHLFIEPHLRTQISYLLQTITLSSNPTRQSSNTPINFQSIPFPPRHVLLGKDTTMQLSSSSIASALQVIPSSSPHISSQTFLAIQPRPPIDPNGNGTNAPNSIITSTPDFSIMEPPNFQVNHADLSEKSFMEIPQPENKTQEGQSETTLCLTTLPSSLQFSKSSSSCVSVDTSISHSSTAPAASTTTVRAEGSKNVLRTKKKRKKLTLTSDILAKDLEELGRKRAIKREPMEDCILPSSDNPEPPKELPQTEMPASTLGDPLSMVLSTSDGSEAGISVPDIAMSPIVKFSSPTSRPSSLLKDISQVEVPPSPSEEYRWAAPHAHVSGDASHSDMTAHAQIDALSIHVPHAKMPNGPTALPLPDFMDTDSSDVPPNVHEAISESVDDRIENTRAPSPVAVQLESHGDPGKSDNQVSLVPTTVEEQPLATSNTTDLPSPRSPIFSDHLEREYISTDQSAQQVPRAEEGATPATGDSLVSDSVSNDADHEMGDVPQNAQSEVESLLDGPTGLPPPLTAHAGTIGNVLPDEVPTNASQPRDGDVLSPPIEALANNFQSIDGDVVALSIEGLTSYVQASDGHFASSLTEISTNNTQPREEDVVSPPIGTLINNFRPREVDVASPPTDISTNDFQPRERDVASPPAEVSTNDSHLRARDVASPSTDVQASHEQRNSSPTPSEGIIITEQELIPRDETNETDTPTDILPQDIRDTVSDSPSGQVNTLKYTPNALHYEDAQPQNNEKRRSPSPSKLTENPLQTDGMSADATTQYPREHGANEPPPLPQMPHHKVDGTGDVDAPVNNESIAGAEVHNEPEAPRPISAVDNIEDSSAFGSETRILAIQEGLQKRSTATFRFEIPREQYEALKLWNNRKNIKTGLQKSLCLSLACYPPKNSVGVRKNVQQLNEYPSCWPTKRELSMNVLYNGKRINLPLSPPFKVTPNGLVDVSEFLCQGSNVIELNQHVDLTGYAFVLRAHYPTPGQLEEIARTQKKQQEWQEWRQRITRPLDTFQIPVFS